VIDAMLDRLCGQPLEERHAVGPGRDELFVT
jgi:hypothetical protein